MANQPGLNELLKWSVENSDASKTTSTQTNGPPAKTSVTARPSSPSTTTTTAPDRAPTGPAADALRSLLGGPSDADLMLAAMRCITYSSDPSAAATAPSPSDRLTAFHNLEELVEQIDNANNLAPLGLWTPLLGQLESPEPRLREMAAWTVGTAVQNNAAQQERLVTLGGVGRLVDVAVGDEDAAVRKKARRALSCAMRNLQGVVREVVRVAPAEVGLGGREWRAGEMADVDEMVSLFEKAGEEKDRS